jgi:lactoylglutathione lyase
VTTFNHVGQCVTDLDRSRRFYEQVFGFEVVRELHPDDASSALLRLEPPMGMTALYLKRDGFVLELLHFAEAGTVAAPTRVMNEPGLTHISLGVDDLETALAAVVEHGGEVLVDTNLGVAVFVRDPDGQLIELLTDWTPP